MRHVPSNVHQTPALVFLLSALIAACSGASVSTAPDASIDASAVADIGSIETAVRHDAVAEASATSPDSGPVFPPFTAPLEQWTWIDIPGTQCADGSPTGIGVNFTERSRDVLIFLEGGGACWDANSCWGLVPTSVYLGGYGAVDLATDPQIPAMLPFNRGNTSNPFRNMNWVYVPYCTGDVHAGDNIVTYSLNGVNHVTRHLGYRNLSIDLQHIVATLASPSHVWLSGDSAGGFGAALNLEQVQQAFPAVTVNVLDDSGQPIQPDPARWQLWKQAWNVHFPAGCPQCADQISDYVDYYRQNYPSNRFGLISYTNDTVITTFMNLQPATFSSELVTLANHMDAEWPNGHYFFIPGVLHVGMLAPSQALLTWIQQLVDDDPALMSSRP